MPQRQEQKEKSTGRDASDWISNLPQGVWNILDVPASMFVQKVSSAFLCEDDIALVSIPFTDSHCRAISSFLLLSAYCNLFPKDPYY